MSGTLYLVATPIGNLGDFSPRAAETLGAVDFIAAEDTRVSVKLLNHFQIKKPLVSYHEHNHAAAGQAILQRLLAGESCALVTDAGTPAISDPGEDLVRLCAENGVEVLSIPGCCAAVNALAVSGLPTGRFTFEGFITVNKKSRRERLDSLKNEERTMIFHEAPHKLRATLEDLRETFGPDRRVALCRELTKLHEETVRTTLGEAAAYYQENTPKGEYVLVVAGSPPRETAAVTLEEGTEQVLRLVAQGIRLKDAAREVSAHTGLSKNELYAAALELSLIHISEPTRLALMTRAGHAAQKTPMRRTPHGRHVFSAQGAHSSFNSFRHLGQIFFPLNTVMSLVASQKTQLGLYFFRMTDEPST